MSDIEQRLLTIIGEYEKIAKKFDIIMTNQLEIQRELKSQSTTITNIEVKQRYIEKMIKDKEELKKQQQNEKEFREKYFNADGSYKMWLGGSETLIDRDRRMERYGEY